MDKIDERNLKDKMKRSVIKRWQVRFMTEEEAKALKAKEDAEAAIEQEQEAVEEERKRKSKPVQKPVDEAAYLSAMEVYERLQAEAEEDEKRKIEEQKEAYAEAAWKEKTGADALYGSKPVEEEDERERIARILAEKEEQLHKVVEEHKAE